MTDREGERHDRSILAQRRPALLALAAVLALCGRRRRRSASQITVVVAVAAGGCSDIGLRTIAAKVEQTGRAADRGRGAARRRRRDGDARGEGCASGRADAAARRATPPSSSIRPCRAAPSTIRSPTSSRSRRCSRFPVMLAVPSAVEAKSVPELVALAKRKPGGLSYASQGVGTAGHLLGELFAKSTGAPLVHVPYRGAAPAVIDLVAGRVDMMFVGVLPSKAASRRPARCARSPSPPRRGCRRFRTRRRWPRPATRTSIPNSSGSGWSRRPGRRSR